MSQTDGNILFYDTETTGLPLWNDPSEDPRQPHIVDLAGLLFTPHGELIETFEALVKPDGWVIPQECIDVHGITNEMAAEQGIDEAAALAQFMALYEKAGARGGHNEQFDARMLRIALKRFAGTTQEERDMAAEAFKTKPRHCTMLLTKPVLNLPATEAMRRSGRGNWKKAPSLSESYAHFFPGEVIEGAHRAMTDARATARVYFKHAIGIDIGR